MPESYLPFEKMGKALDVFVVCVGKHYKCV